MTTVVPSAAVAATGLGILPVCCANGQLQAAKPPNLRGKRIFFARFAHETNTFHPRRTTTFSVVDPKPGNEPISLDAWRQSGLNVVGGISASPAGGGTVDGAACRAAMARVVQSLRVAMPVDAVFLSLHGAMFAEGVGPAETVLVEDEEATRRCHAAGEGKRVRLAIGATVEKRFGPPLEVEAEVVRLPRTDTAVVLVSNVEVVLCSHPLAFTDPSQFRACGIDPLSRKIVVVREGYLYPGLRRIVPRHIMLLTAGSGDMRIEKLTYVRRRKPMYPLELDAVFAPV